MPDLICPRKKHAVVRGRIMSIKCRDCTRNESTEKELVAIFHRWRLIPEGDLIRFISLPDMVTRRRIMKDSSHGNSR